MSNLQVLAKEPSWGLKHRIPTENIPPNIMTIQEASGINYVSNTLPVQFGRTFVKGEIPGIPQLIADGVVPSQTVSVKTRWDDGSANLCVLIAGLQIGSNQTKNITFSSVASMGSGESKANMLANYNFDITLSVTVGGVTKTTSARTMLQNDYYEVVDSGPYATTIYLRDHSVARTYDFGFNAYSPLRPIFWVTFYPSLGQYKFRWGIESSLVTEMTDVSSATITVTYGSSSPTQVFTESSVALENALIKSREHWSGTAPGEYNINFNVDYLGYSKGTFRFDPNFTITETTVANRYSEYQGWTKTLNATNPWSVPNNQGAGRPDLCVTYATWFCQFLYSGDWRMRKMAVFIAEQFAAISQQRFREGDATKKIYGTTDGIGHPVSIRSRTNPCTNGDYRSQSNFTEISPCTHSTGIVIENEHIPFVFAIMYLLTGEYYYKENMIFAGAAEVGMHNVHITGYASPANADNRVRGRACRQRFEAAYLADDGSVDKTYLTLVSNDAIQSLEGFWRVDNTPHVGTEPYTTARRYANYPPVNWWEVVFWSKNSAAPPLKFQTYTELNNGTDVGWPADPALCDGMTVGWMISMSATALGRAGECGFDVSRILPLITAPFVEGIVNNYVAGTYFNAVITSPALKKGGTHPQTWDEVNAMLFSELRNVPRDPQASYHFDHWYVLMCRIAATFGTTNPLQSQALAAFDSWVYTSVKASNFQNPGQCVLSR